ncbi:hypothetical protein IF1G_05686 [Cordyceps javanica]|uniref:Uncharacterized protein n=1 Tax=Cordyceps javanica TaxID=43265 RepID=A0A545VZ06_9HYPO|nr:hypothetical protein IF1G_05686 [Cordyceps javanica]TQW06948.1 hypothetical protein IF2G_05332 [Cordyceps javanica]
MPICFRRPLKRLNLTPISPRHPPPPSHPSNPSNHRDNQYFGLRSGTTQQARQLPPLSPSSMLSFSTSHLRLVPVSHPTSLIAGGIY